MILGAQVNRGVTKYDQLIWSVTSTPNLFTAPINAMYHVTRQVYPFGIEYFKVYKNGVMYEVTTHAQLDNKLRSNGYAIPVEPPPPQQTTPPVIPVVQPVNDPTGPESGSGSFFEDNKMYIYAAAAILGIAYFMKK